MLVSFSEKQVLRWDGPFKDSVRGNACVREDARLQRRLGKPSDCGAGLSLSEGDREKQV